MPMSAVPPSPAIPRTIVSSLPLALRALFVPVAQAAVFSNATSWYGTFHATHGYVPPKTSMQHAGFWTTVLGPSIFIKLRTAIAPPHPAHAVWPLLKSSSSGISLSFMAPHLLLLSQRTPVPPFLA